MTILVVGKILETALEFFDRIFLSNEVKYEYEDDTYYTCRLNGDLYIICNQHNINRNADVAYIEGGLSKNRLRYIQHELLKDSPLKEQNKLVSFGDIDDLVMYNKR